MIETDFSHVESLQVHNQSSSRHIFSWGLAFDWWCLFWWRGKGGFLVAKQHKLHSWLEHLSKFLSTIASPTISWGKDSNIWLLEVGHKNLDYQNTTLGNPAFFLLSSRQSIYVSQACLWLIVQSKIDLRLTTLI